MRSWLAISLVLVTLGCASSDGDGACNVTAPRSCEVDTRWADVEPIFEERCESCHLGERGGPWALTSYSHAAAWPDQIHDAMLNCTMPPADAGIEMPVEERELLLSWIRCGSRD